MLDCTNLSCRETQESFFPHRILLNTTKCSPGDPQLLMIMILVAPTSYPTTWLGLKLNYLAWLTELICQKLASDPFIIASEAKQKVCYFMKINPNVI